LRILIATILILICAPNLNSADYKAVVRLKKGSPVRADSLIVAAEKQGLQVGCLVWNDSGLSVEFKLPVAADSLKIKSICSGIALAKDRPKMVMVKDSTRTGK
jgi:hypothetical protein